MLFSNTKLLKQAIRQYEIIKKACVKLVKNNKDRVHAKCNNCEGWMLHASLNKKLKAIQIKKKKINDNHNCGLEISETYVTYRWLSKTYGITLKLTPIGLPSLLLIK